jgi:hypothetical protein
MPPDNKDVIRAIDRRIQTQVKPNFEIAYVIGLMPGRVKIRIRGSNVGRIAKVANHLAGAIQIGDEVMIARASEYDDWIIIASTGSENRQDILRSEMLAPPADFVAKSGAGIIVLAWSAPVHAVPSFQIQHNDSASEEEANNIFVSGTQYIYIPESENETATRYFRIRSVSSDLNASGWSDWVSATPGHLFFNNEYFARRPNVSMVDICSIIDVPESNGTEITFAAGSGG